MDFGAQVALWDRREAIFPSLPAWGEMHVMEAALIDFLSLYYRSLLVP